MIGKFPYRNVAPMVNPKFHFTVLHCIASEMKKWSLHKIVIFVSAGERLVTLRQYYVIVVRHNQLIGLSNSGTDYFMKSICKSTYI